MNYLSVCSGIEAASVAWHPLGFTPAAFSEIEPFPKLLLKTRWADVPNLGDMTQFKTWPDYAINLLVGGTPCQSFSVAGLRKGMDDPRGNLALTFLAIAARYRPEWVLWENVPGVLSDRTGGFAALLGGLGKLGYGWAYRILNAEHFGVPQRRRRVFVVGHSGDWRRAAAVLFERHSLQGHSAPRREAGKGVAGTLSARTQGGGRLGTDFELSGGLTSAQYCAPICPTLGAGGNETGGTRPPGTTVDTLECLVASTGETSHCLNAGGMGRQDYETETLISFDTTQVTSRTNRSNPQPGAPCHPLTSQGHPPAISFKPSHFTRGKDGAPSEIFPPLSREADRGDQEALVFQTRIARNGRGQPSDMRPCVAMTSAVRRLLPTECELLMGFPRNYTAIEHRGKLVKDGPRYKALGNSIAVPCLTWIGERLKLVSSR